MGDGCGSTRAIAEGMAMTGLKCPVVDVIVFVILVDDVVDDVVVVVAVAVAVHVAMLHPNYVVSKKPGVLT